MSDVLGSRGHGLLVFMCVCAHVAESDGEWRGVVCGNVYAHLKCAPY